MSRGQEVRAAERRLKAMEFRAAGLTFRQIGAQLGVTHTSARNYVVAGLRAARVDLEKVGKDYVLLELERLEAPVVELVKQLKSGRLSVTELCSVVDAIRKISESRRKLLGMDAPKEFDHTTGGQPFYKLYGFDPEAEAQCGTGGIESSEHDDDGSDA